LSTHTPAVQQKPNSEEHSNYEGYINWSVFSLFVLTLFLILQIAFLEKSVFVPDPSEIKHVDGKLLRTALIRNQKKLDVEILVRSDDEDIAICVPLAESISDSIKFIDKNSSLSIDYYLTTNQGISTRRAWQIKIDGKPFVDYYYSTSNSNQLREFDIKFIAFTGMVWVSLFLSILIMRLGKKSVAPKT
jgi:hypothetical protein